MKLAGGVRLGPYEIIALLGAGGMGDVYTARDTRLDRIVAIKLLRPRSDIDISDHALGEARAAARVNHPRIATLYDVVEGLAVDGVALPPFLVMEYVDGKPLSKVLAKGALEIDRAVSIAIQLADGLAAAHRAGIIHRDVKPANIMLTADGAVKLLDLGIARSLMSGAAVTTATATEMPVAGSPDTGGTPAYMAPEQLLGLPADARTDVFAAGVVLFELLTGRRPFDAPDLATLAMLTKTVPTPAPSSVRGEVPAALDRVVARATTIDPKDRLPSAVELRDALMAVGAPETRAARGRAAMWGAVAATIVIALAAAVWSFRPVRHPRAPLALLPAIATGDNAVQAVGVGLVSLLSDNLSAGPGLTIVSGPGRTPDLVSPSRDLVKAGRALGAGYVVDLQIAGAASRVHLDGTLIEVGRDAPLWHNSYEGTPLDAARWLLAELAGALETAGLFVREPSAGEREKMRRLPTRDPAAFESYTRGQARLETADKESDARDAIAAFEDAVGRDTQFALAYAALSEAYGRLYQWTRDAAWLTRADDAAKRAIAIDPSQARVHAALGAVYQRTGRFEDALREAREAVRLSPTSDAAHRLLANVLLDRNDIDAAVGEIGRAIELRPNFWLNHSTLGYILFKGARYQEAVAAYRRATDLEPSAGNFQRLGTALHYSGHVQEAIGYYKHSVEMSPDPFAYTNLGLSYYISGRYEDALAAWQEAARLSKTPSPVTLRNLADVYERLGQPAKSREYYADAIARARQLLKVNPADVDQIAIIAVCAAKLGQRDEASLRAAEALGLRGDDPNVLYKAAVVEALAGNVDPALAHLKRALERGYPVAFARVDFDFESLRADPRFVALVGPRSD